MRSSSTMGGEFRFIDTAGIRRKGKTHLMAEKLSVVMARKHLEAADIALLVIDATEGVSQLDASIAGYAHESGRSIIIVVNKWDLVYQRVKREPARPTKADRMRESKRPGDREAYEQRLRYELKFLNYAPIVFISAQSGKGTEKIFPLLEEVATERRKRVSTRQMNRFIEQVDFERASVPMKSRVKILYMTQASVAPPTFVLFTNRERKAALLPTSASWKTRSAKPSASLARRSGSRTGQEIRSGPMRSRLPGIARFAGLNLLMLAIVLLMSLAAVGQDTGSSSSSSAKHGKRTSTATSVSLDSGSVIKGIYQNNRLGLACKIPAGWVLRTEEMNAREEPAEAAAPADGATAASSEGARVLLAAFSRPPDARAEDVNASILIAAENQLAYPGLKDAAQYFGPLTEVAKAQGLSVDEEPYEVSVGTRHWSAATFTRMLDLGSCINRRWPCWCTAMQSPSQ